MNSGCKIDTSFNNINPDDTESETTPGDTIPINNCLGCIEDKINSDNFFKKLSYILPEKRQT